MVRKDHADLVYLNAATDKFRRDHRGHQGLRTRAAAGAGRHDLDRNLGAAVASCCKKQGIAHEVLNAKQHEREAHIVAQAGRPGAVTIATNMAGRGTDIVLGGTLEAELARWKPKTGATSTSAKARMKAEWQQRHDAVMAAGGLHIVGTERHESRRIDNQLRGRSGRQGDPGSSRFYLSLEDNLMRIFAADWVAARHGSACGMKEDEVIESTHGHASQIENAQRKVEAHNFDIRKHLLEFDDVANDQRKVIYQQRTELMDSRERRTTTSSASATTSSPTSSRATCRRTRSTSSGTCRAWKRRSQREFGLQARLAEHGSRPRPRSTPSRSRDAGAARTSTRLFDATRKRRSAPRSMRMLEKHIMLNVLDQHWRSTWRAWITCARASTCAAMRRSSRSRNTSAKRSSCSARCWTRSSTKSSRCSRACASAARPKSRRWKRGARQAQAQAQQMQFQHADVGGLGADERSRAGRRRRAWRRRCSPACAEGRPQRSCPCGSGKKYKHCHGQLA